MDQEQYDYRTGLTQAKHDLHRNFNNLVVSLSGGALALSFTFMKDIISLDQAQNVDVLIICWGTLLCSLLSTLFEIVFGIQSYAIAIDQFDDNKREKHPGGKYPHITKGLRYMAAVLCLIGLVCLSIFVYSNSGVK